MVKLHDKPKTPTEKIAAMFVHLKKPELMDDKNADMFLLYSAAMSASQDPALLQETLEFLSNKARDQDVLYFFALMRQNFHGRRLLTKYFQDNYDVVSK